MKLINPSFEILTEVNQDNFLLIVEKAARTCYKSESKVSSGSAEKLVRNLIKNQHLAMLEHAPSITVKFINDRAFTHELVRHRLCAFAQESQRFVDATKTSDIEFIIPTWARNKIHDPILSDACRIFIDSCALAEKTYKELRTAGLKPQEARGVLPNATKTEIVCTANLREWRHILSLRTAPDAHPDMQYTMKMLQKRFINLLPVFFEDIPQGD